jgi:hypothetical protein
MSKGLQYSINNGNTFTQFEITNDDLRLKDNSGIITANVANRFNTVKDSNDNTFILCQTNATVGWVTLIKVDKSGNKTIAYIEYAHGATQSNGGEKNYYMILSRDESKIYLQLSNVNQGSGNSTALRFFSISTVFNNGDNITQIGIASCREIE